MLKGYLPNFLFSNFVYELQLLHIFIMKYITYIAVAIIIGLIVMNAMILDFGNLFQGDSMVALISIIALLCAVCILLIFKMSKSIEEKSK